MPATFSADEDVVRPLHLRAQAGGALDCGGDAHAGPRREARPERHRKFRAEQQREPQPRVRRRIPAAAEAPAARGLPLGEDCEPARVSLASEPCGDVVRRGGFLEGENLAGERIVAELRMQIVCDEAVGRGEQAAAEAGLFLDVKACAAKPRERLGDLSARHAEGVGKIAGKQMHGSRAQFAEEAGVERQRAHVSTSSSEKSTAGAECVSAPTLMKSTPVAAIAFTVASVTPPLASSRTARFFRRAIARLRRAAPWSCCRGGSHPRRRA